MDKPLKTRPSYAIASVDNALRIAAALQLEGPLTVSEVAARFGVATSTAHRLLQMLVYRDFAVHDADRSYRVGPVLELAAHTGSNLASLRRLALPHLRSLVDLLDESANLAVLVGETTRFIASTESSQALRVSSREGMVFPAHETTAGLLLLAELPEVRLAAMYGTDVVGVVTGERPDFRRLKSDLVKVRRQGFALNRERSERGLVALGVPVRGPDSSVVAGLSVSMPSVRYHRDRLRIIVSALRSTARRLEHDVEDSTRQKSTGI